MHPIRQHARILTAALTGTAVEFYDFYVYATAAALVFGPLFFPAESQSAQTMLSFMSFGLAFFARGRTSRTDPRRGGAGQGRAGGLSGAGREVQAGP